MIVPTTGASVEIVVKKSRFIAFSDYIADEEEAKAKLSALRRQHPAASHVVHAWILGESASIFSISDDGEPKHTAGRPVLEVLKGSGLTHVTIMVVRYFGGTKLGTGGLVHAYAEAAKRVLAKTGSAEFMPVIRFHLRLAYESFEQAKRILAQHGSELSDEQFGADVFLAGTIPQSELQAADAALSELTAGKTRIVSVQP
jgi:uncharacterized YigZ family protein